MGGVNVKNTIVERVLQLIAPHPCLGCGKTGVALCLDCKYDIIHEPFLGCFRCGAPSSLGVCKDHTQDIHRTYIVGSRHGTLEASINAFKFQHFKGGALPLAELLVSRLPLLPDNVVLVPIPTVRSHIRQRGYDHCDLLARQLGSLVQRPVERVLERAGLATQHTVGRAVRQRQAQSAFRQKKGAAVSPDKIYVLVDDVVTTGSTLTEAAKILTPSGAMVWAAALAYQPLDA